MNHGQRTRRRSGYRSFTLIEIIAVVIVLGIVGAALTAGLVASTEGFTLGERRTELAQQAQIAMQRMILELRFPAVDATTHEPVIAVEDGGTTVRFTSRRDSLEHVFTKVGQQILFDGRTLMEHVLSFQVTYSTTTGELAIDLNVNDIGAFSTSLYP